jgi:predicted nucleic acid-binding protein
VYVGDSSYFVALADPEDRWHRDAVRLRAAVPQRFVVSDLTVAEAVTIVGARLGPRNARTLYQFFLDACEVVFIDRGLLDDAMAYHLQLGGRLSVTDCVSLSLMERKGIREILTYDGDFDRVKAISRVH